MGKLNEEVIGKMKDIVENCMGDSNPACQATCPMNTDVKGYIKLIGQEKNKEAIALIREQLFLPKTLGRICAHPCESACRRNEEDKGLAVASLKRYVADNFDNAEDWNVEKKDATGKKVAIIGAGPAGAQAAIELSKNGHEVVIYEKLEVLGGMMRVGIPEYRLPRDVIDEEYSILEKLGVKIKLGVEIGNDISFEELKNMYDAVVVTIGRQLGRIDNNLVQKSLESSEVTEAKGIYHAAEYLKEISLTRNFEGVGKKVLVVGGGDVAMDCARSSLRLAGVEEVHSICLEKTKEEMASSMHEIHGATDEGISFNLGRGIEKLVFSKEGRVEEAILNECTSIFDENGAFSPKYNLENKKILDVDTVVFAIGQGVDSSFDKDKILGLKNNGTFDIDSLTMQSKTDDKVFVAGDCAGAFIVVDAMAEGRRAAISVDRFLENKDLKEGRTLEAEGSYETKLNLPKEYLPEGWDSAEKINRVVGSELDPKTRINSFDEVEKVFTKEEALKESNRCLECACKLCMNECLMLNDFTDCPKTLFTEYLEKGYEAIDPLIAYSCNACSQCTLECPKDFDIKKTFLGMRPEYVNDNNGKSPIKAHSVIDVHQALGFSKVFNTVNEAPKPKKTKYVFFPGCSLPSYNPEVVGKVTSHLQDRLEGGVGSILRCCGKPTKALGQKDKFAERFGTVQADLDAMGAEVVVVACQSCMATFSEYATQKVVSLWNLLPEIGLPEGQKGIGKDSDVVFNIHDSCSTRDRKDLHDGVRWIMKELGYVNEELEHTRETTRCCGFGGMVLPANPDLVDRLRKRRVEESTHGHMITYCAACRESMEVGGADAQHILDLVFRKTPYMQKDAKKRNMGPAGQWIARYKSKMELKKRSK